MRPSGFTPSRGEIAVRWIEKYTRRPDDGGAVRLSPDQLAAVRAFYSVRNGAGTLPVAKDLGAYLTLLHLVGHLPGKPVPDFRVDSFTVRRAASPALRAYLERDGEVISCLGLGTRFSAAA